MNVKKIFITIIIPVYNVERYIDCCLSSIKNQTFTNFEVIIIDDGSTDGSSNICMQYASMDARFSYIRIENSGQGKARNIGIEKAKGQWLCFVDSDDFLPKNALESLISKSFEVDVVIGNYYCLGKDSRNIEESFFDVRYKNDLTEIDYVGNALGSTYYGATSTTNVGVPWAKIYNRKFIQDNNIKFPDIRRMQDTVFNLCVFIKNPKINFVNEGVYYYRINDNSSIIKYWPNFSKISEQLRNEIWNVLQLSQDKKYLSLFYYKSNLLLLESIRLKYAHIDNKESFFRKCVSLSKELDDKKIKDGLKKIDIKLYTRNEIIQLKLLRYKIICPYLLMKIWKNRSCINRK